MPGLDIASTLDESARAQLAGIAAWQYDMLDLTASELTDASTLVDECRSEEQATAALCLTKE